MKKLIVKNIEIFQSWFAYIFLRIPVSEKTLDSLDTFYKDGTREKKLLARIRKINQNK